MGIFDKENVTKANEEATKKRGNRISEPGIYEMTLFKGEVKQSKSGNQMIVLTFSHEEFDSIEEYYVFNKEKPAQALKIVTIMGSGFGYEFLPIDAMTDHEEAVEVLKQIEPYFSKQLKVAVSIQEDLYEFQDKDSKAFITIMTNKPKVWYVGQLTDKMTINKAKAITRLTPDKQAKWTAYQLKHPKRTDPRPDDDVTENTRQRIEKEGDGVNPNKPLEQLREEESDDMPF